MKDVITAIQIRGWQSWLDAYIEFLPGVNIIHGESGQGKSAFIRLLIWTLMNDTRMSVDKFRNWKLKKNSSVFSDVQFGSDEWVSREQSRTLNRYQVYNIEDPLDTVRSSVPKEVGDIIRMNPINFQKQKTWFMLDKSPGQIAKEFNKLTNLGILDAAISECNSRVRSLNSELTKLSKEEKYLKETVERNTGVLLIAEKEFDEILQLDITIQKNSEKYNKIFRILQNANEIQKDLEFHELIQPALKDILIIKDLDNKIDSLIDDGEKISLLIADIEETQEIMEESGDVSTALQDVNEIWNLDEQIGDLSSIFHQTLDLVEMIENQQKIVEQIKIDWRKLEQQFHKDLKELGYCPTCKRKIK